MPRNLFLKFHWLFGKNDSLKWKKPKQTPLEGLTLWVHLFAEAIWTWIPPDCEMSKTQITHLHGSAIYSEKWHLKVEKIESLWWEKKSGANLESFANMPFKRNIERKTTTQNATLIWSQIFFDVNVSLSRWVVSKEFILDFHPPTFWKRSNVTNLYMFFKKYGSVNDFGGSSQSVVVVTPTSPKFNMEPENKSLEGRKVLLETMIFRFHVKFWGCIPYSQTMDFRPFEKWLPQNTYPACMKPCKIMGLFLPYHQVFSPDFLLPSTVLGCPAGT